MANSPITAEELQLLRDLRDGKPVVINDDQAFRLERRSLLRIVAGKLELTAVGRERANASEVVAQKLRGVQRRKVRQLPF